MIYVYPVGDDNKTQDFPAVGIFLTFGIVVLHALLVLPVLLTFNPGTILSTYERVYSFGLIPAEFVAGERLYTALTAMFLHGDFGHVIGNALFLWTFSHRLEDCLGHLAFLIFFLAAGMAGHLAHIHSDLTSEIPMVGASGAISGLMGAYLVRFPKLHIRMAFVFIIRIIFTFRVQAVYLLVLWIGMQIGFSLLAPSGEGGGVAFLAHIGGFAFGAVVMLFMRLLGGARESANDMVEEFVIRKATEEDRQALRALRQSRKTTLSEDEIYVPQPQSAALKPKRRL